jgi:hypothetical protein
MPYDDAKQSRAAFLRKLTYYLCGIAIGFMVLGVLHNAKKADGPQRDVTRFSTAACGD